MASWTSFAANSLGPSLRAPSRVVRDFDVAIGLALWQAATVPTVSEVLFSEFPEQFEIASRWRARLSEVEAERSILELVVPEVRQPPGVRGVLGVGLTAWGIGGAKTPLPAVLVQSSAPAVLELLPGQGPTFSRDVDDEAFAELRRIRVTVAEAVDWESSELAIIGLPAPVEQVAPGEEARCGGGQASFGSRIWTQGGQRGILTAGHAAPQVATGAYDASAQLLGTVVDSVRCASVTAGVETPDIATIELNAHIPDTVLAAPHATAPAVASLWDTLTAYGAVTSGAQARVLVAGTPVAGPNDKVGVFGEAILTTYAISAAGDSGAPVYNQSGELIGHVVAGNPGVYSVVQDATYQLRAFGAKLR